MKNVDELIKKSKHFCILPWCHFHAWPNKDVMLCCVAKSTSPVSKIEDGKSILDIVNSDRYKEVRVAMLNDEPIPECERCYTLEALGEWTMRNSHNGRYGEDLANVVKKTNSDGSIDDFKMTYMDMRFSNKCNFKCRSCGPACSSTFGKEVVEQKGYAHFAQYYGDNEQVDMCKGNTFFEELTPYLNDVREVYFAGGEAIIHDEQLKCLDYWIENGLTDQINVEYTTNFSTLKYKGRDMIEIWKKFPKVSIWASLDAMGPEAELIRSGTKWNNIVANIKRLKEEAPHVQFQITPTISVWNVFHFPKFFDWMIENEYITVGKHPNIPRVNLVTQPPWANIQILPDHVREELIKIYSDYVKKYDTDEFQGFEMVKYALEQGCVNKELLEEFKNENIKYDKYRGESISTILPELFEVYMWLKSN